MGEAYQAIYPQTLRAQFLGFYPPPLRSVAPFMDRKPKAESLGDILKITELIRREAGLQLNPALLQDGAHDSLGLLFQDIDFWLWKTKLNSSADLSLD